MGENSLWPDKNTCICYTHNHPECLFLSFCPSDRSYLTTAAAREEVFSCSHYRWFWHNQIKNKVLELTFCPLGPVFCFKTTLMVKQNRTVQLSTRSRVMSLRHVSCCFMSRQCLMSIRVDLSKPVPITASPKALSAGRVRSIKFYLINTGLISVKRVCKLAAPDKSGSNMQSFISAGEELGSSQPPTPNILTLELLNVSIHADRKREEGRGGA